MAYLGIDPAVLDKLKTMADYQQAEEEFQLKKQLAAATIFRAHKMQQLPAALQLANEYQNRIEAGDLEGANQIAQFAKINDKGIGLGNDGSFTQLPGYAQANAGIAAAKAGAEQQAKDNVKIQTAPVIARGEANARNKSEFDFAAPIAEAKETGKAAGEATANKNKKILQANNSLDILDQIEAKDASGRDLLDKATGSTIGATVAGGKRFFGSSDESTQANAQLELLGNTLINDVPRMEGPQSNADLSFYKAQAAKVADPTVPAADKRAALTSLRQLRQKYATQPVNLMSGKPKLGDIQDGYVFMGGDPANPNSWKMQ